MSERIQFRVWDRQYSCWHSVGVPVFVASDRIMVLHEGESRFRGEAYIDAPGDTKGFIEYSRQRYAIEQSTGLVDTDNRDIYEGDILSFSTNGHPHGPESDDVKGGVVWWDNEEAAFTFGRWTHPNCDEPFDYGYAPCQIRRGTVRVVGNIHEHPHLITP